MIEGLNHITLEVSDINRSFQFYHNILGLKPLCRWHMGAYFLTGETWFCLIVDDSHPSRINSSYTHYAFSINQQNFPVLKQKILDSGAQIFKENVSEGESLYFCDPDGYKLEIHIGNWQTRLASKKLNPGNWQNIQFFTE